MTDYQLAHQARDLSQLFDFAGEDFSGKVTTGPMDQEQLLREYLRFGTDETLPAHFLFADIAYTASAAQSSQPEALRELLVKGMRYGEDVTNALAAQFEEA